jgi:hypothetical protein
MASTGITASTAHATADGRDDPDRNGKRSHDMTSSIGGYSGVSPASLAQMRQQMFQSLDADSSGTVDAAEFAAGPSGSGGMDSSVASALFSAFDTDSSGGLSQDELDTGFQKLSSAMRSVLIGAQETGGAGGPDGPPPPPPPPPSDSGDAGSGSNSLDQLISLLQSVTGSSSGNTGSSSDSTSTDDSAVAAVRSDFKLLINDLLKLGQAGTTQTTAVTA